MRKKQINQRNNQTQREKYGQRIIFNCFQCGKEPRVKNRTICWRCHKDNIENNKINRLNSIEAMNPNFETRNPNFEAMNSIFEARNPNFEAMNSNAEAMNPNFEARNQCLEAMNSIFEVRNTNFEARSPNVEAMNSIFEARNPNFESMNQNFEAVNQCLEAMNPNFESMNSNVEAMNQNFEAMSPNVETILHIEIGGFDSHTEVSNSAFDSTNHEHESRKRCRGFFPRDRNRISQLREEGIEKDLTIQALREQVANLQKQLEEEKREKQIQGEKSKRLEKKSLEIIKQSRNEKRNAKISATFSKKKLTSMENEKRIPKKKKSKPPKQKVFLMKPMPSKNVAPFLDLTWSFETYENFREEVSKFVLGRKGKKKKKSPLFQVHLH
jgi:hypothetical protein